VRAPDERTHTAECADANRLARGRNFYLRKYKIVELVDPWFGPSPHQPGIPAEPG
jgi:hypothetical protein